MARESRKAGAKKQARSKAKASSKVPSVARGRGPRKGVDQRLQERRQRVLQLMGWSVQYTAKTLLEEGFEVASSTDAPVTAAKQKEWEQRRLDSMRKKVAEDRAWWDEHWRKLAKKPKNVEEVGAERERYVAELNTEIDFLGEQLVDTKTKSTARGILSQARLRAREMKAKAQGVADLAPAEQDPESMKPTVVGLIFGTKNLSPETVAKLREQGVALE